MNKSEIKRRKRVPPAPTDQAQASYTPQHVAAQPNASSMAHRRRSQSSGGHGPVGTPGNINPDLQSRVPESNNTSYPPPADFTNFERQLESFASSAHPATQATNRRKRTRRSSANTEPDVMTLSGYERAETALRRASQDAAAQIDNQFAARTSALDRAQRASIEAALDPFLAALGEAETARRTKAEKVAALKAKAERMRAALLAMEREIALLDEEERG